MSSVKSSCTPGFFLWFSRTNLHTVTDVLLPKFSLECPWVYTKGDWTFWTQDMIWLAYVFYRWHIDFKRHFKTVLISQRYLTCFGGGFYFLDSFSFDVVILVLCFVKVMKRGVRCNSTYLANRKGDYDYLLWRRMVGFEVVELEAVCGIPTDAVSQKGEVLCYW